jgi:hypothetical protein
MAKRKSESDADKKRVTFEFYGMCCAAPTGDGKALDVVLPVVDAMPHHARLLIPTDWVAEGEEADDAPANDVVATHGGQTLYVWYLAERELTVDASGQLNTVKPKDGGLKKPEVPQSGETPDVRWLPSLKALTKQDFPASSRKVSKDVTSVVHVRSGGELYSGFGPTLSVFKFVKKVSGNDIPQDTFAVAERFLYQIDGVEAKTLPTIALGAKKIRLRLPDPAPDELVITVSHIAPKAHKIRKDDDMAHFREFYKLVGATAASDPRPVFDRKEKNPDRASVPSTRGGRPVQCGSARI